MKKIQDLIEQIGDLEKVLSLEIQKKQEEFFYKIQGKKVKFDKATRRYHKTLVTSIHTYLFNTRLLNLLVTPVIWSCIIPAFFMDLVITVYQTICFPVYKIPKVRRDHYIVIDRYSLSYLNAIEKVNCLFCGYFTGLIAYVQEIAARTEQYWCPIKHARRIGNIHSRYKKYFEYGDADDYRKGFKKLRRDFEDLK